MDENHEEIRRGMQRANVAAQISMIAAMFGFIALVILAGMWLSPRDEGCQSFDIANSLHLAGCQKRPVWAPKKTN